MIHALIIPMPAQPAIPLRRTTHLSGNSPERVICIHRTWGLY